MHIHRDKAQGVKADVDGLLAGFDPMSDSLSDLENKVQDSLDLINNLKNNLTEVGRMDTSYNGQCGGSICWNKAVCLALLTFRVVPFIQAKNQLTPAEKALDDVTTMIKPMKPQLDELKDLLQDGVQQAQDAQDNAVKAEDEAAAANEVRDLRQMSAFSVSDLSHAVARDLLKHVGAQ